MKLSISKFKFSEKITIFTILAVTLFIAIFFFRKTTYLNIQILVTHDNLVYSGAAPPFWYQEKLSIGSTEKDGIGRTLSKINKVIAYEDYGDRTDTYVDATIRAMYSSRNKYYTFRGNPVLIGAPITIYPGKTIIKGIVTNIAGQEEELKDIIVKVRASAWNYPELTANGIDPMYIENIEAGKQARDMNGKIIAEVLDKQVLPGKRITVDSQGKPRIVDDPYFKEVYLTLKLKVRESNSNYYFMNKYKVKKNEGITLFFDDVKQGFEIIRIVKENP